MQLPQLENPDRYRGLYVYDFGDHAAVGYTAEEIAVLLESEAHGGGKVYRIVRATPSGELELQGVAESVFQQESGMFFYGKDKVALADDFATLRNYAADHPPPARCYLQFADLDRDHLPYRYVIALIYPREFEDAISQWLIAADYSGGIIAEGGPSHVNNYQETEKNILERLQLWPADAIPAREPTEIFATVKQAVQR